MAGWLPIIIFWLAVWNPILRVWGGKLVEMFLRNCCCARPTIVPTTAGHRVTSMLV